MEQAREGDRGLSDNVTTAWLGAKMRSLGRASDPPGLLWGLYLPHPPAHPARPWRGEGTATYHTPFCSSKNVMPCTPRSPRCQYFSWGQGPKTAFPHEGGLLRAPSRPTPGLGGPLESCFPPFFKGKALFEQIFFPSVCEATAPPSDQHGTLKKRMRVLGSK